MDNIVEERINPKLWHHAYLGLRNIRKTIDEVLNLCLNENMDKDVINVLDVGCGQKPYESIIRNFFIRRNKMVNYIGVDVNEQSKADYILNLNNDKLPFESGFFDLIIMTEVLEHIYNIDNALNEVVRCLKKSGYILITTPFVYPYHEPPNDYYRFTRFFYEKKLNEKGLTIEKFIYHNKFFTLPFITFNLAFAYSPFIPVILKKTFIRINNFVSLFLEILQNSLINWISNVYEIDEDKVNYFPMGVIVVARKT